MIKILGINYINEKEAAARYGYSGSWLEKKRYDNLPPNYTKIGGKILYEVDETDKWFKNNMKKTDFV